MGYFGRVTVVAVTAAPHSYGGGITAGVAGVAAAGACSGVFESAGGSSGSLAAAAVIVARSLPTIPSVEIFDRVEFGWGLCRRSFQEGVSPAVVDSCAHACRSRTLHTK